jgi:hypothetical protein
MSGPEGRDSEVRDIARAGLARIAGATKLPALVTLAVVGVLALPGMASAATTLPPTLATSFTPNLIAVTGSSAVQYTIAAPGTTETVFNVTFTDTLPAGVVLDNPVTETDAGCTSSTPSAPIVSFTANPGGSTITVSVPQVKAGSPCTVQFPVVGSAPGGGSDVFTPGSFTFAASATGAATQATSAAPASIQVIPEPTVKLTGLKQGAKLKFGQAVSIKYACAQPATTDPIVTCEASDDLGNDVRSGGKLPTKTAGKHALTVQVIDTLGNVVSRDVNYTVLPDNRFTIGSTKKEAGGSLAFTLALPGTGTVAIKELAGGKLVSSKTAKAHGTGKVKLSGVLKLNGAGKKLLATGKPKVRLQVTFTPTGGTKSTVAKSGITLGG